MAGRKSIPFRMPRCASGNHRLCPGEPRYLHQPSCECRCHFQPKRWKKCAHTREDLKTGAAPCAHQCSALSPSPLPAPGEES